MDRSALCVVDGALDLKVRLAVDGRAGMNTSRAGAPEVATPRVMSATVGWLSIAGAIAAVMTSLPSWAGWSWQTTVMMGLALGTLLAGPGLLVWGRRIPRWPVHLLVAQASLLLATAVILGADDLAAAAAAGIFSSAPSPSCTSSDGLPGLPTLDCC